MSIRFCSHKAVRKITRKKDTYTYTHSSKKEKGKKEKKGKSQKRKKPEKEKARKGKRESGTEDVPNVLFIQASIPRIPFSFFPCLTLPLPPPPQFPSSHATQYERKNSQYSNTVRWLYIPTAKQSSSKPLNSFLSSAPPPGHSGSGAPGGGGG